MNTTAVGALIRRDALVAVSYRATFLLEILFGVLDLAVYFFISRTFDNFSSSELGAAPTYFGFAVVGVLLGAVLIATSSSVGNRVRDEQLTGTLEALAAAPVTPFELCVGLVGFPFVFAVARAGIYLTIAVTALDLDVSSADWGGLLLVLLVTGAAIAPVGILAGAAALTVKRGHIVSSTAVYVMTLLGGMVFPVAVLPEWLQWLSPLVPLRYAFDGARAAMFTGGGWGLDVLILLGTAAILWPAALVLFNWALKFARRRATLAEF